jgi:hypothetical protein
MRVERAEASGDETVMEMRMREAVVLLAREWPDDYPTWAVEWLIAAGK